MNYPMISKRYVIASADPEFIGPLTSGYLGNNKKYISEFEISSSVGLRNNLWNSSKHRITSIFLYWFFVIWNFRLFTIYRGFFFD